MGYCTGIENYSRHLDGRVPGEPPYTLIDYFPKDFLIFLDESHLTVPQLTGMYHGDQSRKRTLVEHGFRLPCALDNRPLNFGEFEERVHQVFYVSATPSDYELKKSGGVFVEQVIRPTGLVDPEMVVEKATHQVDHLQAEIRKTVEQGGRVLVTTLTKRMSEDSDRVLPRNRHPGPIPSFGHQDPREDGDPPGSPVGEVRCPDRDQPAPGGARSARGGPGGDTGRGQGRLPPIRTLTDPDLRPHRA